MKIALLGATGQTGKPLIEQALAKGHTVRAIVRSPEKLEDLQKDKPNLEVVKGDIFSVEEMQEYVKDVDVVMSTLGFSLREKPVEGYFRATKAAVEALRASSPGCRRLVLMHSWYTKPEKRDEAAFFMRWFLIPFIKPVLDNMDETEKYLQEHCSDMEWTTVLPPGLTNGPVTDKEFKIKENDYQVPGADSRVSRADVARFMIQVAEEGSYKQKPVAFSH